ncbi:hypothetical protein CLV30_12543 [Haloactinopolyspora alba]|uniref:Pyrroloquinoline-quinone binding quinoprotein n=1 Tax=Haloactinopolyspora alba TaxID=648780 RepID=A0A2P8DHF9_9ACTN|nr:zinc metallochaperone AztD [Haloactinopolyspora alba]PSK96662.1 hypothetical protein CLV30_12543 [Haloactinopolyspora alba]
MTFRTMPTRRVLAAPLTIAALTLTACGTDDDAGTPSAGSTGAPTEQPRETDDATPRLVATYDGGALVLDGETLDVLETFDAEGFTRVNPAGDGRHVLWSVGDAFRVIDTGVWSGEHGDHEHHYVQDPALTDIEFEADHPGHVVHHAGLTALFSDGSGKIEIFDPNALAEGRPETETHTTAEAHHGVAVQLENGELVTTLGDEDSRSGIVVHNADGQEVTRNEQCAGVHGEAPAADGALLFGCENGVLIYRDGRITKVDSPDPYGRIGNQAGSHASPVVLGDYKVDPDAELERPERVSLIDTRSGTLRLVDLGTSYSFRSLGRGPHGAALVLGTDGAIHVIDPATAEVTTSIPVVDPWTEPMRWQQPRPTLTVVGHTAYVTEPAADEIHAVDLESRTVTSTTGLPATPNELTGVSG